MSASLRAWSSGAARRIWGKVGAKTDPARHCSDTDERRHLAIARNEEALFDQDLAFLRHQLERKTQSLNISTFEVTEEWLFEFASLHAEYMEKASSNKSSHQFRSTTDLLHHVLQHPSVIHMFEAWGKGSSKAEPTDLEKQLDFGDIHLSSTAKAQCLPEESALVSKPLVKSSSSACIDESTRLGDHQSLEEMDSRELHRQRFLDSSLARSRGPAIASAPKKEQFKSLRRVSAPTAGCTNKEGELSQKLRQRAGRKSWQGLSPRSLRLAQAVSVDGSNIVGDAADSPEKLAARRRLLEDKLKSCGFHKHAPTGGA